MEKQVKSKQRVFEHGEVFTNEREVRAMCDLVKSETEKIGSRFLEPACGNGNFLAEILTRKLNTVKRKYKGNDIEYELYSVLSVTSIYGVELLSDNADECRKRLFDIWNNEYLRNCKTVKDECRKFVEFVLGRNILCADALTMLKDDGKPIVFSEWTLASNNNILNYDFKFDDLLNENTNKTNMNFDVIIGNPPYQHNDGGNGASASPIYHLFVEKAIRLNPRYITMIIPARWYAGGKGLDKFRKAMLNDEHLREIDDFVSANDCFSDVKIKGGVCYFLWDREYEGDCTVVSHKRDRIISKAKRALLEYGNDTFIRYNEAVSIFRKVKRLNEPTFDLLVSARKPFGFATNFSDYSKKSSDVQNIAVYAHKDKGFISKKSVIKNYDWIDKWKLYIPEAIGHGNMAHDVVKPIIGQPNTVCTETYIVIGPFDDENTVKNIKSYVETKFFHFLLGLKKITQHTTAKTYTFIPQQDFSKPWTDEELYLKYRLSKREINYIENSVRKS